MDGTKRGRCNGVRMWYLRTDRLNIHLDRIDRTCYTEPNDRLGGDGRSRGLGHPSRREKDERSKKTYNGTGQSIILSYSLNDP